MAEQNFKNHTRIDPWLYGVILPVLLANFIVALVRVAEHPTLWRGWLGVVALVLVLLASRVRSYALKVQDRVIRLEERIRMAALLPLESRALQAELTTEQIIALRFASDGELAELATRAASEKLPPKTIKQQIVQWRADRHRV